jgi:acyl carrier protein phosphodiesterase
VNHLAHALVAERAGGSIVGNLMGDFVKGRPEDRYGGALLAGIRLHRRVDVFADENEVFARSRVRILPPLRRYAGILVDIFYDHFLAKRWTEFADRPLRDFADAVYEELRTEHDALPPRMTGFVSYMIDTDLLVAYREREGIARAFAGMSRRIRHENPLNEAIGELDREYEALESDFLEFFPQLLAAVDSGEIRRLA